LDLSVDVTATLDLGVKGFSPGTSMVEQGSVDAVVLDGLDLVFKKTDPGKSLILALRALRKLEIDKKRKLADRNARNSFENTGKDMGRRATRVMIEGDVLGEGAHKTVLELRQKHLKGHALEFVSKPSLESGINKVLIEELDANSVKGRPFHFQYRLLLVEYVEPVVQNRIA
jgi:hypothetical protein